MKFVNLIEELFQDLSCETHSCKAYLMMSGEPGVQIDSSKGKYFFTLSNHKLYGMYLDHAMYNSWRFLGEIHDLNTLDKIKSFVNDYDSFVNGYDN